MALVDVERPAVRVERAVEVRVRPAAPVLTGPAVLRPWNLRADVVLQRLRGLPPRRKAGDQRPRLGIRELGGGEDLAIGIEARLSQRVDDDRVLLLVLRTGR